MSRRRATSDRRTFLGAAATAAAFTATASRTGAGTLVQAGAAGPDLGTLFPNVLRLAEAGGYPLSYLEPSFEDVQSWRTQARAKVLELFHYHPPLPGQAAQVLERWESDGYIQEQVEFSTAPWFRVPAYVLLPKGFSGRRPAIVDLHSHGGMYMFGKEKVMPMPGGDHPAITEYRSQNYEGRSTSVELCRRGYVVISIDAFYFGERKAVFDDLPMSRQSVASMTVPEVREANRRSGRGESTLSKGLFWAGTTWAGIVHWDDIRTVDYLVTRPEVDPDRIGCMGISMGGDRTNYLAALDDRIRCAVSVGWMSTLRELVRSHLDTHSFVHFLPGLTRFMDLPDLLGCMAPKPLMVQYCSRDNLYTLEGMERSQEKLAAIYRKAGAADRLQTPFYPIGHVFSREMQEHAFDWLDRWLQP